MISRTDLAKLWSEIRPQIGQTVGRRADPDHPLDYFISYDEKPEMQLMLVTDTLPQLPNSSKQISVRGNPRADGNYAICFSLENDGLKDQFISLCWDIMECTSDKEDKHEGVRYAVKRFAKWQKLFAELKENKLSESGVKGLIGELVLLKDYCIKKYGKTKAITGWVGPLGTDRDFEYDDFWFESKYVSLSMDKVKISSLDQLDIDNAGYLVLCRAEKAASSSTRSTSLNNLVDEITRTLNDDDNVLETFKNRLLLLGYDPNDERSEQTYEIHGLEFYYVEGPRFPRIVRRQCDGCIVDCEYMLSIPGLQEWRTEMIT